MPAADPSPKRQGEADPSEQWEAQPADAGEAAQHGDHVDRQRGQSRPADDGAGINPQRQQEAGSPPADDGPDSGDDDDSERG